MDNYSLWKSEMTKDIKGGTGNTLIKYLTLPMKHYSVKRWWISHKCILQTLRVKQILKYN